MKTSVSCLMVAVFFVFFLASAGQAQFTVTQLTDNAVQDQWMLPNDLKINASGQVVWEETDDIPTYSDILFYDGTQVIRITDDLEYDYYPSVNDNGIVVWMRINWMDAEIYLYDGSSITNISNNPGSADYYPQINNSGQVVWQGCGGGDCEIYLFDGTSVTQLTDNDYDDEIPPINNAGHVVWVGSDGLDREIFFYNGASVINISDNTYDDQWPKINDSDQVVWQADPGTGNLEIFLYSGIVGGTQLTDNTYDDRVPKINNSGHVVWGGVDTDSDSEIFLFDGTNTTNLTLDNPDSASWPWINNNGNVVWSGIDNCTGNSVIFLYDGTKTMAMTDPADSMDKQWPRIGDAGHVAWEAHDDSDMEIFLATPPEPPVCTDNDGDGYGAPASPLCPHPELDCNDFNAGINPGSFALISPSHGAYLAYPPTFQWNPGCFEYFKFYIYGTDIGLISFWLPAHATSFQMPASVWYSFLHIGNYYWGILGVDSITLESRFAGPWRFVKIY